MSGVSFTTRKKHPHGSPPPASNQRGSIGFGSGALRNTTASRGTNLGVTAVYERSGNARYSLFRCASQPPSRENHLRAFKEATVACEPQYSGVVETEPRGTGSFSEEFYVKSRNKKLFPTSESMSLALRGAHGISAGDRNSSRAPSSTHAHAGYAPATTTLVSRPHSPSRCVSADSPKLAVLSESSILSAGGSHAGNESPFLNGIVSRPTSGASAASGPFYGRPCSSKAMRDLWKMSFAPTDAAVHPTSEFAAAPSTVQRNTFLYQEYTKRGQLLMRPSSGDSRPDSVYRPVTYVEERTLPYSLTSMRPFGDLASYNVMVAPRPASSTYHSRQMTPTTAAASVTPVNNGADISERPGSRRECRCPSRQSTLSGASDGRF
ncbi:Hypothetical protein, putative [Bodo saltans]|uniref:Uncharacterized protein n=1 Tax=Bodo saltans TaxID=75058 RepID=A0A0S4JMR3_BODSA|nr:Hypothetical protein, putative [Bodo saltans]|eukprot:CUG92811.1 Hypothetical protein, putative [Bodo saltans]